MRGRTRSAVLALLLTLVAPMANASTIYSTLAPTNTYQWEGAYAIDGCTNACNPAGPYNTLDLFPVSSTASVTQIDLGLTNSVGTNSAQVTLWTNVGGLPGVLLGSWNVFNLPDYLTFGAGGPGGSSPLTTISGISGIVLNAGSSYFLQVAAIDQSTQAGWNINVNLDFNSSILYQSVGGINNGTPYIPSISFSLPAFDVLGTDVPEPGSLALLCAGLAGLGLARRRRGKVSHSS